MEFTLSSFFHLSQSPAASLGEISKFSSFTSLEKLNAYLCLNISSAVALTAGMLQAFPCRPGLRRIVVNISSTFALNPKQKWSLYCTTKIARKMMFGILAEEEPSVKVLSYSPGKEHKSNQIHLRGKHSCLRLQTNFQCVCMIR